VLLSGNNYSKCRGGVKWCIWFGFTPKWCINWCIGVAFVWKCLISSNMFES